MCCDSWGRKKSDTTEWLNWTELSGFLCQFHSCFLHSTNTDYTAIIGLLRWHSGKESTCQCRRRRRPGFSPLFGKSPGEGNGNPLQYSYLENLHGQRSLAGYSPWGCKESDMTEQPSMHTHTHTHTHTHPCLNKCLWVPLLLWMGLAVFRRLNEGGQDSSM